LDTPDDLSFPVDFPCIDEAVSPDARNDGYDHPVCCACPVSIQPTEKQFPQFPAAGVTLIFSRHMAFRDDGRFFLPAP